MREHTIKGKGVFFIVTFIVLMLTVEGVVATDQTISARDLTYITEQYPPYNYQEDGKLQGISIDLLEKIWERMDVNMNRSAIQLLPWTEGYEKTLMENNTVLFLTARLPQREQLFKWAGPIVSGKFVLLAKRDKNISITAPGDLEKYKIGAIEDDLAVQLLLDKGLKKEDLMLRTTPKPIIEMLDNGSIDAWAYNDITGIWQIQESGKNASNYEAAYMLGMADAYLAFNKEVPDSLVRSFQLAIDYVKSNKDSNGATDYEKILYKYIPQSSNRMSVR
jgi:polar amino acid transport system substrate-binding protein